MKSWLRLVVLSLFFIGLNSKLFACNLCAAETHQHPSEHQEKTMTQEHKHEEGKPAEKKTPEEEEKVFKKTVYVCPMGCETKDEPGRCSKCGMNLEKKEVYRTYACPEEKCDYHQAKPSECLEHKKKLIKTEVTFHCPKCDAEVRPEELKKKPKK